MKIGQRALVISVISISLLTGCQASLTMYSQPQGAYITNTSTGMSYGLAPVKVYYDSDKIDRDSDGCFLVTGFEARWVSGAIDRTEPSIKLCGSNSADYAITFNRNPSAPGLDKDLFFQAQLQNLNAQQAAAQRSQAAAQEERARDADRTTNCRSTVYGNTVNTSCN